MRHSLPVLLLVVMVRLSMEFGDGTTAICARSEGETNDWGVRDKMEGDRDRDKENGGGRRKDSVCDRNPIRGVALVKWLGGEGRVCAIV